MKCIVDILCVHFFNLYYYYIDFHPFFYHSSIVQLREYKGNEKPSHNRMHWISTLEKSVTTISSKHFEIQVDYRIFGFFVLTKNLSIGWFISRIFCLYRDRPKQKQDSKEQKLSISCLCFQSNYNKFLTHQERVTNVAWKSFQLYLWDTDMFKCSSHENDILLSIRFDTFVTQ